MPNMHGFNKTQYSILTALAAEKHTAYQLADKLQLPVAEIRKALGELSESGDVLWNGFQYVSICPFVGDIAESYL